MEDSYPQRTLSSRRGIGSSILCPRHSLKRNWDIGLSAPYPHNAGALLPGLLSSSALLCSDASLLPYSPVPALRNGVTSTCSLGTWSRWRGWGRQPWAPLSGFSWTPHVSFCVGREFVPVLCCWPQQKVSLGDTEPFKALDGGGTMGLGHGFCSPKGLCFLKHCSP